MRDFRYDSEAEPNMRTAQTSAATAFMKANDKSKVVIGWANYEGGGGGYKLKNGKSFTLTLEDARSLLEGYPIWDFPTDTITEAPTVAAQQCGLNKEGLAAAIEAANELVCDGGAPVHEYVNAIVSAYLSHAAGDVAGLVAELRTDSYALSDVHSVAAPLRDLRHEAATALLALSARVEAAEDRAGTGWISVTDKLPGEQGCDSENVLCFLNGHCGMLDMECRNGGGWGIRIGFYDAEKQCFRAGGIAREVTHWMPLPAAPDAARSLSIKEAGNV